MIAAIYARKSTEQNLPDEEKSIARQVAHARAYATRKGWTCAEAQVYADDGISGADFLTRPGFLRLMNALKPRPPFQVLIMSEESRLGREQIETAYALKQIIQAGVRVFFYLEDRERTLDNAMDKVMLSLANFVAELEREKARQRTHDALARKAAARHVTGGRVYGYDNVEVFGAGGARSHVLRRINEGQAAVVRRIFALTVEGLGITRIAKALNEDGVAPPRRASGWAPTAIREILRRPLYRGEIVWNRIQKRDQWGLKRYLERAEGEWLRVEAPELRIVPEDLWRAAHVRLDRARAAWDAGSRPPLERPHEQYLLSGIAKCSQCGGSLVAFTRDMKRTRRRLYGCMYHHKRGGKVCRNGLLIRQERLDQVVLDAIAEALDDQLLARAVEKALERLRRAPQRAKDRRATIQAELVLIGARVGRLVDEIARGYATDALRGQLQAEEERKRALQVELGVLASATDATLDAGQIRRQLGRQAANVRALLGKNIPQTRQILRKLLVGRLTCEPFEEGERRGYRFTGQGSYAPILPGEGQPSTEPPGVTTFLATGVARIKRSMPACPVKR